MTVVHLTYLCWSLRKFDLDNPFCAGNNNVDHDSEYFIEDKFKIKCSWNLNAFSIIHPSACSLPHNFEKILIFVCKFTKIPLSRYRNHWNLCNKWLTYLFTMLTTNFCLVVVVIDKGEEWVYSLLKAGDDWKLSSYINTPNFF